MLKIQFKDGSGDPVDLVPPGKTIGQGSVNDIVIDKDGVNGFHADIQVDGDAVSITDINTPSGTLVNGDKISGPTNLRAGDVITVGGVELEVVEEDPAAGGKTLVLSGTALIEVGSSSWSLVTDTGPEKGQVIPVVERIEIGRALDCDISILEPGLSRKHAELEPVGDKLTLRDLGSVNGTWVNAEKVDEVELKDGDQLQFDKVRFIVSAPN
ncbi:MAG: FHA domain-containing protein [Pseudomonadales bacterium]|nr:FHA domain-containing protein [Pseudomonadales bacterium]MBO6566764.1 FHA domain-containing protein [Pseudomonadales bacterium]MBO6595538.1 FHA domain-containing protein [Pseudomonadales bacterium]MBO6702038.1 FHA domain-containing protein [Pseudomonadales bacterium]MBO6820903.1 FHA domain-containing protein [Pseudomonadales bacterium]